MSSTQLAGWDTKSFVPATDNSIPDEYGKKRQELVKTETKRITSLQQAGIRAGDPEIEAVTADPRADFGSPGKRSG